MRLQGYGDQKRLRMLENSEANLVPLLTLSQAPADGARCTIADELGNDSCNLPCTKLHFPRDSSSFGQASQKLWEKQADVTVQQPRPAHRSNPQITAMRLFASAVYRELFPAPLRQGKSKSEKVICVRTSERGLSEASTRFRACDGIRSWWSVVSDHGVVPGSAKLCMVDQ